MCFRHAGNGSGNARSSHAVEAFAVNHIPPFIQIHVAGGSRRSRFPVIKGGSLPAGRPVYKEAPAADISGNGIDHRQGKLHGNGGICGIPSSPQNINTRLRSGRMRRHNHAAVFHQRLTGRHRPARQQG
ncbi:hypothetical protein Barb6_01688 [Bacteroidales bacterium Barb6]|nr:hypothetical protein Barb6_01688 [Bacteroidales bacterium Barb6]